MEYMSVPSPAFRIGDLGELYENQIPAEFFMLEQSNAAEHAHNEISKLTSEANTVHQLQQDCSLDALFIDDDHTTLEGILKVTPKRDPSLMPLKTLACLQSQNSESATKVVPSTKRVPKPSIDLSYKNVVDESPEATELLRDIFVTVLVNRPACLPNLDIVGQARYLIPSQRIVLLGSQTLANLKDAIKCPQDKVWLGDCSDALDDPELHIPAERLYKSAYFFIERTFYDDLRHPGTTSISEPVLKWVQSKEEFDSSGPYVSSTMDAVNLNDLTIHVGKPYYYVHQGNCEHVIIFSDVSIIDREACQSRESFPMLTGRNYIRPLRCAACKRLPTRWLASNCGDLLPTDPCPLCDVCIRLLLYDSAGLDDEELLMCTKLIESGVNPMALAMIVHTAKQSQLSIPTDRR
ncbi:hypothetical protein EG68_02793 [Paragonimus skrjabini miyazakii]|uniref:snRNA-activating protein complex subunit 3 n=1 Tax=Paragonimus skrjabini miyazakii TaxID=59628 RepID=A0A8S9Z6V3_9TREM|nr:hypothetical protein EG68_02793 [Paragonimus skrjabini miyazakii]